MKGIRKIIFATIFLLIVALSSLGIWYISYVVSPGPQAATEAVIVTIPGGSSVRTIGEVLGRAGVVHSDIRFLILVKLSGYATRIPAGEFRLPTGRKPAEVLQALLSARPVEYAVTIPEGLRISEMAEIFAKGGWCDADNFTGLAHNRQFLKKLGYPHLASLEGYLFPDTYLLTKNIHGAAKILAIMVRRFTDVWQELAIENGHNLDQEKIVILASIVEKETGIPEERALIAGVFQNRLRLGMRLQSDPTVVYGTRSFSQKISKKDLKTPTSYNTYIIFGLPAGAICNPGKEALEAAIYPLSTKHSYFVAKNDGSHHFSVTLAEHNRAVQKYQRNKSAEKGKKIGGTMVESK